MQTLRKARDRLYDDVPRLEEAAVSAVRDAAVQLRFFPKQVEFINLPGYLAAMVGGIGGGKTTALMGWVAQQMYSERGSGTVGGVFANTYQQLSQSTLPELWAAFDHLGFEHGRDYVYNEAPPSWWDFPSRFKKKHDAVLTVRWWGQAIVRSLDNPKSIRGTTLGWACLDEARDTDLESFEIVVGRVRCPKARSHKVRIATSPSGFDWVYKMFVEKPVAGSRLVLVKTADNPFLPEGYEARLREMYDPKLAAQELDGKFLALTEGAVYRCFDRSVHVKHDIVADPKADYYVSFDFNRTPFCAVLAQPRMVDGVRHLVVLDEIFLKDADTQLACDTLINATIPKHRPPREHAQDARGLVRVYGDPAGRARSTKNNYSDYDIITKNFGAAYGPEFVPSWAYRAPPVLESVNAVNALMMNSAGKSRFAVHSRCMYLIRDLEQLRFKPGTSDVDKTTDPMLSHCADSLRYAVAAEFPLRSMKVGRASI